MTQEQSKKISKAINYYYNSLIAELDLSNNFDWELKEVYKQEKEELLELLNYE